MRKTPARPVVLAVFVAAVLLAAGSLHGEPLIKYVVRGGSRPAKKVEPSADATPAEPSLSNDGGAKSERSVLRAIHSPPKRAEVETTHLDSSAGSPSLRQRLATRIAEPAKKMASKIPATTSPNHAQAASAQVQAAAALISTHEPPGPNETIATSPSNSGPSLSNARPRTDNEVAKHGTPSFPKTLNQKSVLSTKVLASIAKTHRPKKRTVELATVPAASMSPLPVPAPPVPAPPVTTPNGLDSRTGGRRSSPAIPFAGQQIDQRLPNAPRTKSRDYSLTSGHLAPDRLAPTPPGPTQMNKNATRQERPADPFVRTQIRLAPAPGSPLRSLPPAPPAPPAPLAPLAVEQVETESQVADVAAPLAETIKKIESWTEIAPPPPSSIVMHAEAKPALEPEPMNSELVEKIVGQPSLIAFVSQPTNDSSNTHDAETIDGDWTSAADDESDAVGLRPIDRVTINVRPPEGELPPDHASARFDRDGEVVQRMGTSRQWMMFEVNWEAASLATRPVYFEDVNLERYGYSHGFLLEPFFSAAHFFVRVPFIPYMRGASPPLRPVYTLGYGRPGTYFPYYLHRPPLSVRGGLQQAATAVGLVFILP